MSMSGIIPDLSSIQATDSCQVLFLKFFCRIPLDLPSYFLYPCTFCVFSTCARYLNELW